MALQQRVLCRGRKGRGRTTLRWTDGGQAAGHPAVGSQAQKAARSGKSCGGSGLVLRHSGRMASCPSLGTGLRQGCPLL